MIIVSFSLFTSLGLSQKLIDIYKNGMVKLIPEMTYGANNNWGSLFNLYFDSINFNREEGEKKIITAPDGSVFMSHKNRHEIWKFGPDGNFVKSFGSKGGKPNQFPMLPSVETVVDGKYVLTNDVNARLKLFDLDGNYFKSMKLDYMAGNFQPLSNGEILLEGNVMWRSQEPGSKYFSFKWRHVIVKLNIYSGEDKIIYDFFENGDFLYPVSQNMDSIKGIPPPGDKIYMPNYMIFRRPVFTLLKDGRFIQSSRETGEVKVFDKAGKPQSSFKLEISPMSLTEKDISDNYEEIYNTLLNNIEMIKSNTTIAENRKRTFLSQSQASLDRINRYKDLSNYFPHLPYFSNIILDDEGNFLVFEFTDKEERQSNIFNVIAYDSSGQKLARTSFVCDNYDLSFSESTFVISKGYAYAVAKLKNFSGMPLRLVKFKITN